MDRIIVGLKIVLRKNSACLYLLMMLLAKNLLDFMIMKALCLPLIVLIVSSKNTAFQKQFIATDTRFITLKELFVQWFYDTMAKSTIFALK
jgi:hypothetical protein